MDLKAVLKEELMLTNAISDEALDSYIKAAQAQLGQPCPSPLSDITDEQVKSAEQDMTNDAVRAYVKAQYCLNYENDVPKFDSYMRIFNQYRTELKLISVARAIAKLN